jgi:hypothetical protein
MKLIFNKIYSWVEEIKREKYCLKFVHHKGCLHYLFLRRKTRKKIVSAYLDGANIAQLAKDFDTSEQLVEDLLSDDFYMKR